MAVDPAVRDVEDDAGVTRVRRALADAGALGQVVVLDHPPRSAADLAQQLGAPGCVVLPQLLTTSDDGDGTARAGGPRTVMVLTASPHPVELDRVAGVLGVSSVARAGAALVRARTGFDAGRLAPVGHLRPVDTLVDVALAGCDVVWAPAGHPCALFPTRYEELLRITLGHPLEVDRAGRGGRAQPA